jgi:hypothetical protein
MIPAADCPVKWFEYTCAAGTGLFFAGCYIPAYIFISTPALSGFDIFIT